MKHICCMYLWFRLFSASLLCLILVVDCFYGLMQHSFPDSVGDDLIVEVQGSKGKCYGRVLVQVAVVAEDPVS